MTKDFCCNLSPQSNTSLRNWQFFSTSKKQGWRRHLRRLHSDDAETCQPSSSPPRPSSRQADSGVGGRQTGDNLGLSQQAQSHLDFSRHLVVTYFPRLGQLRKSECQITSLQIFRGSILSKTKKCQKEKKRNKEEVRLVKALDKLPQYLPKLLKQKNAKISNIRIKCFQCLTEVTHSVRVLT